MLFLLEHLEAGESISVLEEKEYLVGRKNCDILILNDQSISREHAKLRVKDGSVFLEDCKSRYQTLHNGSKLEPYVSVKLQPMDLIHFGILQSKFRFECHKFVVTGSGLSANSKASLKEHLKVCNSKYLDKWSSVCTHLTVEKLTLTIKVLQALVHEKPIVTVDYWADYANAIKENAPAPDIAKYSKPPVAESLFSSDFEYTFDRRRKTLFENKMFIFLKTSTKKQLQDVIKSCGGSCSSWEEEPKSVSDISQSPLEHLLIKTGNDEESESFQKIVKHLAKEKKRMIPINEIALAIVFCSCEVNCNPSFNKVLEVFASPATKTQIGNVLAVETQTQDVNRTFETEKVIPGSIEDDWVEKLDANQSRNQQEADRSATKRPSEQIESPVTKRPKLDNNYRKQSKWISLDKCNNVSKCQDKSPEQQSRENSPLQSQSSLKRKSSDNIEPCLKANPFTNILPPSSKKSKTSGALNPFAVFKITNPTRPEAAKSSNNPFASIMTATRSAPAVKVERMDNENSPPHETRPASAESSTSKAGTSLAQIAVNVRWLSKAFPSSQTTKVEDDPDVADISKALSNGIQLTTLTAYERPIAADELDSFNGARNFKKFRKVKPLRPQITIISHNHLERVGPGDVSNINATDNVSDEEPDRSRGRNIPNVKPVGKRFIL